MKILQITDHFMPVIGGVEFYVYYLSKELAKLGHEVTVITSNDPPGKISESIEGIRVFRIPMLFKYDKFVFSPSLPFHLKNYDADIMHAHFSGVPGFIELASFMARLKKTPLIITYHNDLIGGTPLKKTIAALYNNLFCVHLLKSATRIITTTPGYITISKYLEKVKNNTQVVPVGINTRFFRPIKEGYNTVLEKYHLTTQDIILFVGSLERQHRHKGVDYLIKAIPMIKKECPFVKIVIVGHGNAANDYKRLAEKLGATNHVLFTGTISFEELRLFYNIASVVALPSISKQEGFGMVLLEAMACGKPIVASKIGGIPYWVEEGENGFLVQPKNSKQLAEAIITLLQNKELRDKMGTRNRRYVTERYEWKTVAKNIDAIYKETLAIVPK